MPDEVATPAVRLTALSIADVVKILSRTGDRATTEAMLREDIANGAPMNVDGTVNLIHFGAWLARELADDG